MDFILIARWIVYCFSFMSQLVFPVSTKMFSSKTIKKSLVFDDIQKLEIKIISWLYKNVSFFILSQFQQNNRDNFSSNRWDFQKYLEFENRVLFTWEILLSAFNIQRNYEEMAAVLPEWGK